MMDFVQTMMTTLAIVAIVLLVLFLVFHFLGPRATSWFRYNREEKIGLSKNKLYNANGYIVQSGSEILLGSTGSFKRFDSVDREYSPQPQFGQTTLSTPPWTSVTDEKIPPQPLRPAPSPSYKTKEKIIHHPVIKQQSVVETKPLSSAPITIKSVPRPVPRKQLSAPAAPCSIPLLNPPESLQKFVKEIKESTNPFLNGLLNFENIKSSLFPSGIFHQPPATDEFKIENERASKSACNNPFLEEAEDKNVFDFNPTTIKSILEESNDDGYDGDNDDDDPLKQLEERIIKIEASGKRRSLDEASLKENSEVLLQQQNSLVGLTRPNKSNDSLNHINKNFNSLDKENANVFDKFMDSSISESLDSFNKNYRKHIRNRSFSENEASELTIFSEQEIGDQVSPLSAQSPITISTSNPFYPKRLHKTPSETYLEQYSLMKANSPTTISTGNNKTPPILSKHPSLTKILGSNHSIESNEITSIKRAPSCESVSSDSSVVMGDLEQYTNPVTGQLCIGLQYDKNNVTEEGSELCVTVLEAKDLKPPADAERIDTFVRIYVVPDENGAQQTKIFKNSHHPSYQETFSFWITKKNIKRSLWFHLYHTSSKAHTLIGETEMKLTDIKKPITTWLQLSDSRNNFNNVGELMFSLSYLPTAERLTVVVVKARNLKPANRDENSNKTIDNNNEIHNVFVKVYLLKNDKKVSKKKTNTKRGERSPIYNEALIFSVPPYMLSTIQVRLTIVNSVVESVYNENGSRECRESPVGHVIVGSGTDGKGLLHWHQMITSLRKPVAMWHPLRRATK